MIVATLSSGLVQGAAIVGIAYLAAKCVPERNATTRCAVWFVALLALLVVPALTAVSNVGAQLLAALRPASGGHGAVVSLLPVETFAARAAHVPAGAGTWILAIWLGGVAIACGRLVVSYVRIEAIRRRAHPSATCGERVLLSDEIAIPIAAGLYKPVVIVPEAVVESVSCGDLARIVAHERAHIRRNDIAANLIQRLIEAALFFNPWVYLIGRHIVNEREAACDDMAVESTGTAADFAACLASLTQSICSKQAAVLTPSALGSRRAVIARIERLTRHGASGATSVNYYALGGTIMILAILTLALQALSPASTVTANAVWALPSSGSKFVASACAVPNSEAKVITAPPPDIPHSAAPLRGYVNVLVTIAPTGRVSEAVVAHSSGNAEVDAAVLKSATASTYSAARTNCTPVTSTYLFHADFKPQ